MAKAKPKGKKIGFKKLVGQLMAKGKTKAQAGGIAYKQGVKKYGKAGMTAKAKAGRAKH